jgi:hypothetical protein
VRHAFDKGSYFSARERLHQPTARLVAGLVLKPEDSLAVERRRSIDEPNGAVGRLSALTGGAIPRKELPDTGLTRVVDASVRRGRRPLRQERDRCAKPLLPGFNRALRHAHSLRAYPVRPHNAGILPLDSRQVATHSA